jgi:DNA-directed RNA polymerase specialized sigma24 family protein
VRPAPWSHGQHTVVRPGPDHPGDEAETQEEIERWEREAAEKGGRSVHEDDDEYLDEPEPGPDHVLEEIFSGACVRGLRRARQRLEEATAEYEDAIGRARRAGLSWGEIGDLLGVSRQALHRRFRERR